jgi:hypothetical protein
VGQNSNFDRVGCLRCVLCLVCRRYWSTSRGGRCDRCKVGRQIDEEAEQRYRGDCVNNSGVFDVAYQVCVTVD